MCWNATVSLNTFLFGAFGVALALLNGYEPMKLLFFMSFVTIQLIEFFLWTYLDNKRINHIVTTINFVFLILQPFASAFLLHKDRKLMYTLMIAYVFVMLVLLMFSLSKRGGLNKNVLSSSVGPNGHLLWHFMKKENLNLLQLGAYLFFFFAPMILAREYLILSVAAVTLLSSMLLFWKDSTWASMWCWISNIMVFIIVGKILFYDHVCYASQTTAQNLCTK